MKCFKDDQDHCYSRDADHWVVYVCAGCGVAAGACVAVGVAAAVVVVVVAAAVSSAFSVDIST